MTPKDIRVRIVTVGDASGAQTVAQELRKTGQAADQAATVTISAAGRATAAIRQQAEAARSTSTSSSGPGVTIRSPGNSPAAAAAAVGSTQSGNSGPAQAQTQFAQASREAAQAAQQAAAAVRQSAAAEQQSTTATAASTTATATNTQAKNAAATGARTKAQAIAALAAARTRDTAALGAHTTALIVAARVTQSVTAALSANTIARGANAAAARSGTTVYAAATRAAQAETAAVMANTTAANSNAAARTKAAASGNNITANTQATAANTTAAGANAAAQGKTVSSTEAAVAAKGAYTAALAANTTAIAVNSRAAASAVTSIAANITAQNSLKVSLSAVTVGFNTNARAAAADSTALAANTRAFAANAAAVNQAAQARRNATNAAGAASAAAAAASNSTNTTANTAALAANTAAMSPNVTARNKATLATSRNTTAVAANTTALQSNITIIAGQTAATGTNSASKATNTTRIAAQNAALAANLALLRNNTTGLNANTGARNRNTGSTRQGAQANNAFGLAAMQAAYFVDDLQYGLRGIINNVPLLLTSFGLSGGLTGIISILAVGIKVCIDHWHLFSGEMSEAAKTARKATIELFDTAKAADRAAADAENARAAWRNHTLVIEKAGIAYDDLKRKIDAATAARQDSDRQALEKEDAQAALDIANIEARQAEGNITDSDAVIQKRDVYRRVEKKKYDIERAALDQEERDALALSKQKEEQRQKMVDATRNRNATVRSAQEKWGIETFMNPEERKKAEEELKWMEGQLKEREQVVEDTWKSKLVWRERGPGELLPAPEIITNPAYAAAVNRAGAYEDRVREKRQQLELDKLLQSATGLKGRKEQEDKNLADEAALREIDKQIEQIRRPLAANPGRRSTLDAVYGLKSQELTVKSGTEVTKIQDKENQEREKDRVEAEKNAKQEAEDTQKKNAALVEDVLDRLRDRAGADKQSGAFDRSKARNVTGKGGRRGDRLAGIGGQARDKEQLVGDVIKSAEAIKDGVDGGEVQTLFAALQRLGAALDKRDADYVRFGREMLDLARKLEAQQKNLRK